MKAKVLSVYDEGSLPGTPLIGAKGLAVLIDVNGQRTLFDTGLRGNYLSHNMDHLEIDPNSVDRVVISHMHSGHIGGLAEFLEMREGRVGVIVPPGHEDTRKVKVMGIPTKKKGFPKMSDEQAGKMDTVVMNEWIQLSENLFITGIPQEESGAKENILVIMTSKGAVMICGCCHSGLRTAIEHVESESGKKVIAIVGGTHLTGTKRDQLYEAAEMLKGKGPPLLYLSHCTGQPAKMRIREKLGLKAVSDFYVGTEIQFDL
jgi:7,8-dihydropterin-6-yl-methyl-4-(beta-D-ribofuranosyl)aminobenzene 5'-phosphate synthase